MIKCPTCQATQRAPDDHGGRWREEYTYLCPRCLGPFRVTGPLAFLPDPDNIDVDKWIQALEWRITKERV